MKTILVQVLLLTIPFYNLNAQQKFQTDKPGVWTIENHIEDCAGKVEKKPFSVNLTGIVDWLKKNHPMGLSLKGTDIAVSLHGDICEPGFKPTINDHGSKGFINFSFHYFYFKDDKPQTANGWLAHDVEIQINNPLTFFATRLNEQSFQPGDAPDLKQPLTKALEQLNKFYYAYPVQQEIIPGVTLYQGGHLIISNPGRPNFFVQVTVKEVMEAKLNYYKIKKQVDSINYKKLQAEFAKLNVKMEAGKGNATSVYDIIQEEYKNFSAGELDHLAFSSSTDGICQVNAKGSGMLIVKFNADFWNRNLPRSAVQLMSFTYRPQSNTELEEFKKRNSQLTDYAGLFVNGLPVKEMAGLIQKK